MGTFTIAFYNTENFFEPDDDGSKRDDEYTPNGIRKWTKSRYDDKVRKIGQAIHLIGREETNQPPLIVGLAEVENKNVLNDLIHSTFLEEYNYEYIHFESLDKRGIDTALIFRSNLIQVLDKEIIRLTFYEESTRDVLYVKFIIQKKVLHTFVVHLPSRRNLDVKREFRNLILDEIRSKVDEILKIDSNSHIVLMGDFNGEPDDEDMMQILKTQSKAQLKVGELYNPMLNMKKRTGSLIHEGNWVLYDQIIFSRAFLKHKLADFQIKKVEVFRDRLLKNNNAQYAGVPLRTYVGKKYLGGYSDHFPIYTILNY